MKRPSGRRVLAVALGTAAAVGIGTVAVAAIPNSSTGVISACFVTSGANAGALKVIDAQAGATCPAGQTPLAWNTKGIAFRGAYNAATAYKVNDVVTQGGSSYIAKLNNTGVPVSNTTNWAVLAAKGAAGAAGQQGPTGPTQAGLFVDLPTWASATTNAWLDVASANYTVAAGADVVARFGAESICSGTSWCSVRILVDGVEMAGGSGDSFAFDDPDTGSSWEAHAFDRYAAHLSAGSHTFTVQAQLVGGTTGSASFRLDDSTLTLQTIG